MSDGFGTEIGPSGCSLDILLCEHIEFHDSNTILQHRRDLLTWWIILDFEYVDCVKCRMNPEGVSLGTVALTSTLFVCPFRASHPPCGSGPSG